MRSDIDNLKRDLKEQRHDGSDGNLVDFKSLSGIIKTVQYSTATTTNLDNATSAVNVPKSIRDQIFIAYNTTGPAYKLYVYDSISRVWKSVTIA